MATTKKGIVTKIASTDTATVIVHRAVFHPLYKKRYRMTKKFLVDTGKHDLGVGDEVLITEVRPLSKRKHFTITEILKSAPRVDEVKEEEDVEKVIHREKEKSPASKPATDPASDTPSEESPSDDSDATPAT
jgi:small subunit ribosomal protein S17